MAVALPSLLPSLKQNTLATAVDLGPPGAAKTHQNRPGLLGPLDRQFSNGRDGAAGHQNGAVIGKGNVGQPPFKDNRAYPANCFDGSEQ